MIPKCCQNCPNLNKGPCSCTLPSLEQHFPQPCPVDFGPPTISSNTFSISVPKSLKDYSDVEILNEFARRFKNTVLADWQYTTLLEIIGPKFIRKYLRSLKKTKELV